MKIPAKRFNLTQLTIVLLSGIIIGSIFTWLIGSFFIKEIIPNTNNFVQSDIDRNIDNETISRLGADRKIIYIDTSKKRINRDTLNKIDTSESNNEIEINLNKIDTISYDSTLNNDELVVMKDRLLFVTTFTLYIEQNHNDKMLDSLLIDKQINADNNLYTIELWKSPINYSGYKMINRRIIIFGIYNVTNLSLKYLEDIFYLRSQDIYYQIKHENEFSPLKILNDQKIIEKLNK